MPNRTTSEAQKQAALDVLEQAFCYWTGDVLKPCAKEAYEDTPLAA